MNQTHQTKPTNLLSNSKFEGFLSTLIEIKIIPLCLPNWHHRKRKKEGNCLVAHLLPLGHLGCCILRGTTGSWAWQHAARVSFSVALWLERWHTLALEVLNTVHEQCMAKYKFRRQGDLAQFLLYKSPIEQQAHGGLLKPWSPKNILRMTNFPEQTKARKPALRQDAVLIREYTIWTTLYLLEERRTVEVSNCWS